MLLTWLGVILLLFVQADFLITTLSGGIHGPLSGRMAFRSWRTLQRLHRGHHGSFLYSYSGLIVMSVMVFAWLLLAAGGWVLIFRGHPSSLIIPSTGAPANWVETSAYAGSALSTMGSSNAIPSNGWWDLWGTVAAANGFVLLTLSMTYILTVMQTVASGRSFALLVASLDPADPRHFPIFATSFNQLVAQLSSVPMALYFSSSRPELRLARAISKFAAAIEHSPELWSSFEPGFRVLPAVTTADINGPKLTAAEVARWADAFSLAENRLT